MTKLNAKAIANLLILFVLLAGLIFISAGTLRYRQGWTFLLVYFTASLAITLDLMWRDPALLARRMSGGPWAENEPAQRLIMMITSAGFIALIVIPGLDRRFGWSAVPPVVTLGRRCADAARLCRHRSRVPGEQLLVGDHRIGG